MAATAGMRLLVLLSLSAAAVWGRPSPSADMPSALHATTLLPDRLVAGYLSWGECDDKAIRAAQDGVNVLIWCANFSADAHQRRASCSAHAVTASAHLCYLPQVCHQPGDGPTDGRCLHHGRAGPGVRG